MIRIPQNMKDKITDSDLVDERLSDYFWNNQSLTTNYAKGRLLGVKAEYEAHKEYLTEEQFNHYVGDLDSPDTTSNFKSTLRLIFGYNLLVPTLTHNMIKLYSEEASQLLEKEVTSEYKNKSEEMIKLCTEDHLFGTTEVGLQVFLAYKNSGWDINYMINEWLPQHLYLWLQVRILKSEHQGSGSIKRGKHTIEEKIALVHYDEANIKVKVI